MIRTRSQIPDIVNFISGSLSLVISGDWQKYAAHIIKPTQTGINLNKYKFCLMKSSEPPKNLKNHPRPCGFHPYHQGSEHRRKKSRRNTFTSFKYHSIVFLQTGININKYKFCIMKSSEPSKNLKTIRVPVDFILIRGPEHRRKKVEEIWVQFHRFPPWCSRLKHLCLAACPNIDGDEVCVYLRLFLRLSVHK